MAIRMPRRARMLAALADDPEAAAEAAKLTYVSDTRRGIIRRPAESGFDYIDGSGVVISDATEIARIRSLAIPPAYRDVWICPDPAGHLQAVGWDARGRKQYRYHPQWRQVRDEVKFSRMFFFGRVLPQVRMRVDADLQLPGLPRGKVLAALVRLLETTLMRVGNEEYAQTNKSYGLTTLRNRHVKVAGATITFDFRGKHGLQHHIDLSDRRLSRIVRRCQDLPGQDLFQFLGEDGQPHPIGSADVNDYLREISGEDITAKDFRTWAATNLAAIAFGELVVQDSSTRTKKSVVQAVEAVAKMLGNTPSVCRKCYIHPAIIDGYLDGSLLHDLAEHASAAFRRAWRGVAAA